MLVVWCQITKVNANSSEILMIAKVLFQALISACVVQLCFSIITVNYHHDDITLIFLFLWNSQNFLQLKMDFICISTSFDCFNKNSIHTLMLNCPFKIFLLSRVCWSAPSLLFAFIITVTALSFMLDFRKKEKWKTLSLTSLSPAWKPFPCMFTICLEVLYFGKLTNARI